MKKFKLIILSSLAALAAIYLIASLLILPAIAQRALVQSLQNAGLDTSFVPAPQSVIGGLLYKDIPLDKDSFSFIGSLRVFYDPLTLITAGKFERLEIDSLNLTGDWADQSFSSISFAGWNPAVLKRLPFSSFKHIALRNAQISFITQSAGGIVVTIDGTADQKNGKREFQGQIKSAQPALTLDAGAKGVIDGPQWYADITLEDGKFESALHALDIKATRTVGSLNFSSVKSEPFKITGQLRAGGVNIYGLPWRDVTASIDFAHGTFQTLMQGKAPGRDGIELSLTAGLTENLIPSAHGDIYGEKASMLAGYFKAHPGFEPLAKGLVTLKEKPGIDVAYILQNSQTVNYRIKAPGTAEKPGSITLTAASGKN